jgi:D-xylose transport system ATP-binding protein
VNVLSGMCRADGGTILLDDVRVRIDSPGRAHSLGIATVFQGLALCENLDVVKNLFLGREIGSFWMDESTMERQSTQLLRQIFSTVSRVRDRVGDLSGGQRQTVAIARTLLGNPSIVILDEPTAALGTTQRMQVLDQITQLRARGLGVIMISHNLDDVGAVADRVVVLRHGRNNGVFQVATRRTQSDGATGSGDCSTSISRSHEDLSVHRVAQDLHRSKRSAQSSPNTCIFISASLSSTSSASSRMKATPDTVASGRPSYSVTSCCS